MSSPEPKSTEPTVPEKLESPIKPLLWLLIPFIVLLIYGFASG